MTVGADDVAFCDLCKYDIESVSVLNHLSDAAHLLFALTMIKVHGARRKLTAAVLAGNPFDWLQGLPQ